MDRKKAIDFAISRLLQGERDLDKLKREAGKRFMLSSMITNPELLANFPRQKLTPAIKELLIKKPTKTISGVTPVAVMTRPEGSCRWKCIYCPPIGLAAKSYTGYEPAALRGRQNHFDPYLQASSRVKQLEEAGHAADKCEIIVMGGTFLQTDPEYKRFFIKGLYDALNGWRANTLEEAMEANETAKRRIIGLTLETRPDVCLPYIKEMLSYGATRVELGVQHADDRIYKLIRRGHKVKDVVDATKGLKNAAFKVLYHIMPGLPGSDRRKDLAFVKKLFSDERFRPDMLKIYPTLVLRGTLLHDWMRKGKYEPYSTEEAADLISEFYRHIPKYVRVMRIQRDIPVPRISSGVKKSNLRELVEERIREKGIEPLEIRYREVGMQKKMPDLSKFKIRRTDYKASGGKEVFLSYEDKDGIIAGFTRLRIPSSKSECALIRELHVYGSEVPIDMSGLDRVQHHGIGSKLLNEAEDIAADLGKEKMIVISGVGAREYYKKHSYAKLGPYMAKKLNSATAHRY